ncbi:hypothetical protein Tco_0797539 [Tanacetum coccineum]
MFIPIMAENVIAVGAKNRPSMLKRSQHDSWQSRMLLYILGKEHGDSVKNGPFEFGTIDATNIILQGLPPDVYTLVNHHKVAKEIWDKVKLLMEGFDVPSFLLTDDPIESLNKAMTFINFTLTSRYLQTNNQLGTSSNPRNQATIQDGRCTQPKRASNSEWFEDKMLLAQAPQEGVIFYEEQLAFMEDSGERVESDTDARAPTTTGIFQTYDIDAFDLDCDEAPATSAVFMANLTSYDLDLLSKVPNYDTYQDNNVFDQSVQEMHYSEQPVLVNDSNIKITSNSNVISYKQYLKENKNEVVQGTTCPKQEEVMIMSVIDEMSDLVSKCNAVNKENKIINESLTVELERYKGMVKILE